MVYVAAIPRCRAERFLVVEVFDQPPCHEAPERFDQVVDDMPVDDTVVHDMPVASRARAVVGWTVSCVRWMRGKWCMVDRWWADPCGIGLPLGKQTGPGGSK